VYEAGNEIAGLASTFQEDGFTYDFGAHFLTNRLAQETGVIDQCRLVQHYGESVYLAGRHYSYPLGLLLHPRFLAGGLATLSPGHKQEADDLGSHFVGLYGRTLAEEIAIPLVEAWSGEPASQLAPSVAGKIPGSIAATMYRKLMSRIQKRAIAIGYGKERPASPKVWHVYPEGGTSLLCRQLAAPLGKQVKTESKVDAIIVENERVTGIRVNGQVQAASTVISTVPCNVLPALVSGSRQLDYLSDFRFRAMAFVMLQLRGRGLLKNTVIWTPGKEFPFFRLTETSISMPWLVPEGKTLITVDFGCERNDDIWKARDEDLAFLCLDKMTALVPDIRSRYLGVRVLRTPYAYPIFLRDYESQRVAFQKETGIGGLYSIGRNGEFDHLLTEDVYWRTLAKIPEVVGYVQSDHRSLAAMAAL